MSKSPPHHGRAPLEYGGIGPAGSAHAVRFIAPGGSYALAGGHISAHCSSADGGDHCSAPVPPTALETSPSAGSGRTPAPARPLSSSRAKKKHACEKPSASAPSRWSRFVWFARAHVPFGRVGSGGHITPLLSSRRSQLAAVAASSEALKAYVFSGSAMLLWPPHRKTSPNATSSRSAAPPPPPPPPEPAVTVSVRFALAGCGGSAASHAPVVTFARTVATTAPSSATVTFSPGAATPHSRAAFGSRCSTMRELKTYASSCSSSGKPAAAASEAVHRSAHNMTTRVLTSGLGRF